MKQPDRPTPETHSSIPPFAPVREQMNDLFNLEELRSLAFDLSINYDNLAGQTLDSKIISLLTYTYHHNQLLVLEAKLKELRPFAEWQFPDPQYLTPDLKLDRNRKNYLNNLKTTWIDGFLHQSLHTEVIKLTMTAANGTVLSKDANRRSWHMVKQEVGQADEPIPLDKPVSALFNESGRGLLILGDPGSGKTITLLQLAESLINEAKLPGQPMPLFLNLSSWAQEKQALTNWLVEEIFVQYSVGRDLARRWITSNSFIYLLDGLDEVAVDARDACVIAINEFRATQPDTIEMVVCSRIADYETLIEHLNLTMAIHIQPLNDAQVANFLHQSNPEMKAIRAMLKYDRVLREMTYSPLLLNVMVLAYQGKTIADLQSLKTADARRKHLFDTYIDAMFIRSPLPPYNFYNEINARHWLAEIAINLSKDQISEFFLEKLQPSWIPQNKLYLRYRILYGSISGLSTGLILGLFFWLSDVIWGNGTRELYSFFIGLFFGVIFESTFKLNAFLYYDELKISPIEILRGPPSPGTFIYIIRKNLVRGLIAGLIIGLVLDLNIWIHHRWIEWISPFPTNWLINLLKTDQYSGPLSQLGGGLIGGLVIGILIGFILILNDSFSKQEIPKKTRPNQGIHSSLLNAIRIFIIFGLFGLLTGEVISKVIGVNFSSLGMGLVFGLFGSLEYGGKSVLQHYTIRWLLSRLSVLPYPFSDKKLITFLDVMVERILLRRTGNGYIFIHRSLMEHFAAKHESQVDT